MFDVVPTSRDADTDLVLLAGVTRDDNRRHGISLTSRPANLSRPTTRSCFGQYFVSSPLQCTTHWPKQFDIQSLPSISPRLWCCLLHLPSRVFGRAVGRVELCRGKHTGSYSLARRVWGWTSCRGRPLTLIRPWPGSQRATAVAVFCFELEYCPSEIQCVLARRRRHFPRNGIGVGQGAGRRCRRTKDQGSGSSSKSSSPSSPPPPPS